MGHAHSLDHAEYAAITPTTCVPMLDWPGDLFSDNASVTDPVNEDFVLECDPAFLPHAQPSKELCIQLAA